jgi:uncharacterized surface protein with fasciclin (FAS1) repeats
MRLISHRLQDRQAAGLMETISGTVPFTVFAPTDDALKATYQ